MTACGMHVGQLRPTRPADTVAFLLDDVWPEYAAFVAASAQADDQIIAPGLFGRPLPRRYEVNAKAKHVATSRVLIRHLMMRRVAHRSGGERQATYLRQDGLLAVAMAKYIHYRVRHLVVAQAWLPWLARAGALGGRTYDVLMTRYPLGEIHRRLDGIIAGGYSDPSLKDFRAAEQLVALEADLLAGARQIVTPHHDLSLMFAGRALRLEWHRPKPKSEPLGTRVAFLGPTIARTLPGAVRQLAAHLEQPLIVLGTDLTGSNYWEGIPIERRSSREGWEAEIGTVLHPAPMTNQPRMLLQARAAGIKVITTPGSGLSPEEYQPFDTVASC